MDELVENVSISLIWGFDNIYVNGGSSAHF